MRHSKTVQSSLAELRAVRAQYVQALESIDAAIVALERVIESAQPTPRPNTKRPQTVGGVESTKTHRGRKPQKFRRPRYRKAIAYVLRRNRPEELSVRQIIEALRAGGRKVKSKDPYRAVYRVMKNSTEFRNRHGKWTLAEKSDDLSASRNKSQDVASNLIAE